MKGRDCEGGWTRKWVGLSGSNESIMYTKAGLKNI